MLRRSRSLVVLPLIGAAAVAVVTAPVSRAASSTAVTFGVPRIVDPIHAYGEPNLEVNPKTGAVHATGPQGTGTQRSIWNISVDGGDSYRILQNLPANTDRAAASGLVPTKSALGPGGGDTEIKIAHNGRAFFNDLAGLASFTAVTTTDDGKTTSVANPDAIPKPLGDRQWMALFDPQPSDHTISPYKGPVPLDYMEYADQVNGDQVAISTDGQDYSTDSGIYANDGVHSPNHGVPLVDQHTGKFLGLTSDKTANSLALVVGVPDAKGLLTYHYNTVALGLKGDPQTLFPVLAQDGARNLYAAWVDDATYQVSYSWAPPGADNEWSHWSTPKVVSQAPARVNVFPWIAAGKAPGVLDVAWYGTDKTLAQLGPDGPSAKIDQTWKLWFSQLTHADSAAPVRDQVAAAPHPMHYNDICLLGTLCVTGAGNRNQADFFKMVVDPLTGRARIIYTDSSNRLSQAENTDTAADHQGAALDTVVTQNTGVSAMTGKPLVANDSTKPVSSITDPTGDALFKPLGGADVPGADITKVSVAKVGSDLVFTLKTQGDLASAALAAGTPSAQYVVRWQMGDTLYFAADEAALAGPDSVYGGKTSSVDLCSVSGCKPNYLTYNAPPDGGVVAGTGGPQDGGTYVIRVPLSAVGNPTSKSLLEEVSAYTFASPQAGVVPQNNGADFADIAPLELEGTRTFNYQFGAPAGTTVLPPATPPGRTPAPTAARPPKHLATTGLDVAVPGLAALLLLVGLLAARRLRRA